MDTLIPEQLDRPRKARIAGTDRDAVSNVDCLASDRRGGWVWTVTSFARDRSASIAVLAALVFPVVLGGIGLGAETSYWYMSQRQLQHTADVAAHAAAARLRAGDSYDDIKAAATHIAIASEFDAARGTLTLNNPPMSGPSAGDPEKVEVLLTATYPRWFTALFEPTPVTLGARAVAGLKGSALACVLALDKTAANAVEIAGSTSVALTNCDVASNSISSASFHKQGNGSSISTGCIYVVGKSSVHGSVTLTRCAEIQENAARIRDPYANVAEPAMLGPCENGNITNNTTVTPTYNHPSGVKSRRFCNGLDIKGDVTFKPGLYLIEGGLFTNTGNTTVSASGVTFYVASTSTITLNGNLSVQLAAPTSGPFSGMLFFGARNATTVSHMINGNSGIITQGAVYLPASHLDFSGNSAVTGGCTQLIARTIELTGNSTLRSVCELAGVRPLWSQELAAILE